MPVGLTNSDPEAPVVVARFDDEQAAFGAIAEAGGFRDLSAGRSVLIKPNLIGYTDRYPFPPYGVLTTTRLVEAVIKAVKDRGVTKIAVGEGSVVNEDVGSSTKIIYDRLGYTELAGRCGLDLIDFNDGPFDLIKPGGKPLRIARALLDADFLIDLPTLKTHTQTTVSLGLKNLKGGLDAKSRQRCHHAKFDLSEMIALFAAELYPSLTIIDGTYLLERGPVHTGTAHRRDILIAGRDALNADMVGAAILGKDPAAIDHLRYFAQKTGRGIDLSAIDIKGLSIDEVKYDAAVDFDWLPDDLAPTVFEKVGLTGFRLPDHDHTLCTGCTFIYNPALVLIMSAHRQGQDMGNAEMLSGKRMKADGSAGTTFLLGDCICSKNRKNEAINNRVEIKGCPPKVADIARALIDNGFPARVEAVEEFMTARYKSYQKRPEFDLSHFAASTA